MHIVPNPKNLQSLVVGHPPPNSIIEQHSVTALFTVPTSFRVIRRADPDGAFGRKYRIDSLRTIFTAGEHCDMETLRWTERTFKVPVSNHWWQTETGSAITATCLGLGCRTATAPAFTTGKPYVGYDGTCAGQVMRRHNKH